MFTDPRRTNVRLAASLLTLLAGSRVSLSQDFSATSPLPQPSVDVVASTARPDDWLFDLDIDSDNNNGFDLPDGSAWEEQIEAHEFSIGKLVETGASRFTPVLVRVNLRADGLPPLEEVRVRFELDDVRGDVRLWNRAQVEVGGQPDGLLETRKLYRPEELNFDTTTGIATIWIEAVEAAPGIGTKADIDYNGRPDMFLRTVLFDTQQRELGSDRVKYLTVDSESFFTTFVEADNRNLRNSFPATLVNGPGGKEGTIRPVPPAESRAYGFRPVKEEELDTLLKTSRLNDNQKRYIADVLYYKSGTLTDPIRGRVHDFRAALYRDFNSGDYTLAFQKSLKDNCTELFRTLPLRLFQEMTSGMVHQRFTAIRISHYLSEEKYGVRLAGLQLAGVGVGGDLAVHGAFGSGTHADTYNTEQIPEEMLEFTLKYDDPKQNRRIELIPGSFDRLKRAENFITNYRILDSPFRVERDPIFPIEWDK